MRGLLRARGAGNPAEDLGIGEEQVEGWVEWEVGEEDEREEFGGCEYFAWGVLC